MLSLDNTYSEDELRAFFDRVVKGLDGEVPTFSIEPKIDGFGIELTYKAGVLVLAATRGDGRVGEDVTANVRAAVKGVPMRLREPVNVTVRGEIYMRKDEFARMNEERARLGEELFKNPRNTAAGSIKQQRSARGREAADARDPLRGARRRAPRQRAPRVARVAQAPRRADLRGQQLGDDVGRARGGRARVAGSPRRAAVRGRRPRRQGR